MKRILPLFLVLFLVSTWKGTGQEANFELAARFTKDNVKKYIGSTRVYPQWVENSHLFWYSYKTDDGKFFYFVDPDKRSKKSLFDNNQLAAQVTQITHKPYNINNLPIKKIEFEKGSKSKFTFEMDDLKFRYNINNRLVTKLDSVDKDKKDDQWKTYSPDSTYIVFARKHNLFLMKADDTDSTEIQITTDGERWYSYQSDDGDTTTTKRLASNARWFKDSKKLYLVRYDSRKVKDLYVINSVTNPRPTLETYKYAMPGEENVWQPQVEIYDVATEKWVKPDLSKWKDQSLDTYLSGKKSDHLFVIRKKRTCDELELCKVNTTTGAVTALFSEESKPYFNDQMSQLHIINEGKEFIWWSERTGWGQLYRYDANGNLKNQITSGNYVTGQAARIDTVNQTIYYSAYGKEKDFDPYYSLFYRTNFDGSGTKLITPEEANHRFSMPKTDKYANYFVDNYSRVDQAPKSVLRDKSGKVVMTLEETDLSRIKELGWQFPEKFVVKASDGVTNLHGVMWKPFDFDPNKKYPVVSYVYPGPQTEAVVRDFTVTARYNTALAQLGCVVVSVGHRGGSPKRHKYYHTYGYDNLRDYALADDQFALQQLANRYDYIDINRVGIFGHSGGGFMSTAAMFAYPDFYKAAVSSAGNHDNNIYNKWWGETHHGVKEVKKKKTAAEKDSTQTTQTQKDSYEITFDSKVPTNPSIAKNLKGHLLLVHGEIDNNVHPANSIRVVKALMDAHKRFDFMIIPNVRHGFSQYSPYFERMLWYHFAEHLIGDYRNNVDMNQP
ncbi:S9 family peptidase [Marinilabiliaceae bacterium JC017]|nr:S9 family peptidase [Marinilabiliaceae bacterium JC017]